MGRLMKAVKMTTSKKTFDCVAFKREAQRRWREATRGMTAEERKSLSRRTIESSPLGPFWRKVSQQAKPASKRGRE